MVDNYCFFFINILLLLFFAKNSNIRGLLNGPPPIRFVPETTSFSNKTNFVLHLYEFLHDFIAVSAFKTLLSCEKMSEAQKFESQEFCALRASLIWMADALACFSC